MVSVKILGISGSHRKGATEYCVQEALKAAATVPGVTTEFVSLRGKKIGHCIHCNKCIKTSQLCQIKDDFQEVQEKFLAADGYILGTPVYQMNSTPLLQDFCSRLRPTYLVYPGHFANRVGGAIATGGTRHGGQEMALLTIKNFFLTYEILVTGGPGGNYCGACVWTKDRKEEGAIEDEIGMEKVRGLGRRVAEAALILKAGKEALQSQGIDLKRETLWFKDHYKDLTEEE
ncbi:2-amino-4-deoxychorismate dehydrogenase [Neomoorella glycerini]|uniref:2-amino-4-deoxychorismate dehydrogenase n=1 Tax=Neomoorella glycerini TaxID=55779 RepID=A0A6I5ZNM3_9FIRM|nr:flavodoxin family protein [Moorella glycerini]QGP91215.1 2-amino-4-deoxychorismate dehydrogenase [Moorella glycerini]